MNSKLYSFRCLLLALALGVTFSACSDDDDDEVVSTEKQITYNGTNYAVKSGLIIDYGGDDSHYDYDFFISDGTFDAGGPVLQVNNAKVAMYAELMSPGTSEFKTGTFNFVQDLDAAANVGKHVFSNASVIVDSNNDNTLGMDDTEIEATGGSIIVSGSNRNYTIVYNLTLSNGKTAKGSYSGTFAYKDER